MTHIYRAIFEIEDASTPLSELIVAARAELQAMAAGDGARLVGEVSWLVAGDRLVSVAPARPLELRPASAVDEVAVERACAGETVSLTEEELLAAVVRLESQGLSAQQIGDRLRRSSRWVQRYRQARRAAA